jgi:hypothetical protein
MSAVDHAELLVSMRQALRKNDDNLFILLTLQFLNNPKRDLEEKYCEDFTSLVLNEISIKRFDVIKDIFDKNIHWINALKEAYAKKSGIGGILRSLDPYIEEKFRIMFNDEFPKATMIRRSAIVHDTTHGPEFRALYGIVTSLNPSVSFPMNMENFDVEIRISETQVIFEIYFTNTNYLSISDSIRFDSIWIAPYAHHLLIGIYEEDIKKQLDDKWLTYIQAFKTRRLQCLEELRRHIDKLIEHSK